MPVERTSGGTSLIDVLDRVLDKGIVIDAWVRVSLVGIDLITVEARVVVASIDTYLKYSEAVSQSVPVARPALEARPYDELAAENEALRAELSSTAGAGVPERSVTWRKRRPRRRKFAAHRSAPPRRRKPSPRPSAKDRRPARPTNCRPRSAMWCEASTSIASSNRRNRSSSAPLASA